jgi:hypothetical protein
MKQKHLVYMLLSTLLLALLASTVAAQSAKPLPETYASDDERLTLRYPAGWVLQTDVPGAIVIATDESLFDLGNEAIPSGGAALAVVFLDSIDLSQVLDTVDDPISVLNSMTKLLLDEDDPTQAELDTPETITFADHPAARVDGTMTGNAIFLMIVDQGGKDYLMYVGIASAGEMPKFEPKLLAIAESVHYLPSTSSQ